MSRMTEPHGDISRVTVYLGLLGSPCLRCSADKRAWGYLGPVTGHTARMPWLRPPQDSNGRPRGWSEASGWVGVTEQGADASRYHR